MAMYGQGQDQRKVALLGGKLGHHDADMTAIRPKCRAVSFNVPVASTLMSHVM